MLFGFVPVLGRYYRMNRLVDVRASRSFSGFMAKTDCSVIELPANAFLSEITRDREGRRRAVLDKERLLRIVQREEELPYLRKRSSRSR